MVERGRGSRGESREVGSPRRRDRADTRAARPYLADSPAGRPYLADWQSARRPIANLRYNKAVESAQVGQKQTVPRVRRGLQNLRQPFQNLMQRLPNLRQRHPNFRH